MRCKADISEFESLVLASLIKEDPEKKCIERQLRSAKVINRDYTGVGLFTSFKIDAGHPPIKSSKRHIEETTKTVLSHPNLQNGAGALLWLEEGYVSVLECYVFDENWPEDESKFDVHA